MSATVHDLTSRLAPTPAADDASPALRPDPSWTYAEMRIWWLGYAAGAADRERYYAEQDARLMAAIQPFLDSYAEQKLQRGRPRLEVVSS